MILASERQTGSHALPDKILVPFEYTLLFASLTPSTLCGRGILYKRYFGTGFRLLLVAISVRN